MYKIVIRKRIMDCYGDLLYTGSTCYDVKNMDGAAILLDSIQNTANIEAKMWHGSYIDAENYGDASIICIKKASD